MFNFFRKPVTEVAQHVSDYHDVVVEFEKIQDATTFVNVYVSTQKADFELRKVEFGANFIVVIHREYIPNEAMWGYRFMKNYEGFNIKHVTVVPNA